MTWDEDLVIELQERGVAFVVIGSIAARWQGVPLDLTDVDVVIANNLDNLARLSDALDELGFRRYGAKHNWGMKQGDVPELIGRQPTTVFVRGSDTHEEELDIMALMTGIGRYEDVVAASTIVHIGGIPIRIATIDAIRRSKEALDRPKDKDHLIAIHKWQERSQQSPSSDASADPQ